MKQVKMMLYVCGVLLMLIGCSDNTNEPSTNNEEENNMNVESSEENTNEKTAQNELNEPESDESEMIDHDSHTSTENNEQVENNATNDEALSEYSSEQIEYARIWLQLGPTQELDELYVRHIPAGELLHPEDETSVGYPEDVIQLSGTRLVDGSITYSGNGDGTINVYNVPLRWDGVYPAGEAFYQEIVDNTALVPVDTGNDEEVIALIKLLHE